MKYPVATKKFEKLGDTRHVERKRHFSTHHLTR